MYMEIARENRETEELKEEFAWARIRELWVPMQTQAFKKPGGGNWQPQDLKRLSFDKKPEQEGPPTLEVFEKLAAKHGKRRKKDGKQQDTRGDGRETQRTKRRV